MDFASFPSSSMYGPGGASVLSGGAMGANPAQPTGMVNSAQGVAAPGKTGYKIPPVVWMFLFLVVGYWGLHMSLKAV